MFVFFPVPQQKKDVDAGKPLVIFDGDCAMCNWAVKTILKLERRPVMEFAPINGETFKRVIPKGLHGRETMMLQMDGMTLIESDAVLQIARLLGGPWSLAVVFFLVPKWIRNSIYKWVARNRYTFFGRNESCYLPPAEVRERFLP